MSDGRTKASKTGAPTKKDAKQKLDRDWNKISKMLDKRKEGGSVNEDVVAKLAKYT